MNTAAILVIVPVIAALGLITAIVVIEPAALAESHPLTQGQCIPKIENLTKRQCQDIFQNNP